MAVGSFASTPGTFAPDSDTIEAVWQKGTVVPGANPFEWRKDACGAWMSRNAYGQRSNAYGWEADHIVPRSKGGSDSISNLQPLHWENNVGKADDYPKWNCTVTSAGNRNVPV